MDTFFNKEPKIEQPDNREMESGNFNFEKRGDFQEITRDKQLEKVNLSIPANNPVADVSPIIVSPLKIREQKIENVLASDLDRFYQAMSPRQQAEFKDKGEKTAREINRLLEDTKINVKKIISLIKNWLMMIPGVNVFFIEQETKIKTDEIIRLKNNEER